MVTSMKKRTRTGVALAALLGMAGTAAAAADSFHWGNVAIGGGGFVSAIVASPLEKGLFYARTDVGGAYRWSEADQKWIALTDWIGPDQTGLMGVEAIAVDPKDPATVYMQCGTVYFSQAKDGIGRSAFLRSKDYGKTWETNWTWNDDVKLFNSHGNGMGRGAGERLAIDPNNSDVMYYGSRNKGLFKSIDNGKNWKHVDALTKVSGSDTTWNGCGFAFVAFAPGSSSVLYAGMFRDGENVFTSLDGGATWTALAIPAKLTATASGKHVRLMPQRAVVNAADSSLIATFSDGAGPHTMAWDEGWGMIYDGFGRGAVLKYNVAAGTWSDISPADYIDDNATGASKFDSLNVKDNLVKDGHYAYMAPYGGISTNPSNPKEMVITTEGYTGAQYWEEGGKLVDRWGTQIFYTQDGGATWIQSFRWQQSATTSPMSSNGIGWMGSSYLHWAGSAAIDPFNPKRVWLTSGNGVFRTDDVSSFTIPDGTTKDAHGVYDPYSMTNTQLWKVASQGIEEVVPLELVSIPGGPMISVIGDYDGFRHDDVTAYPADIMRTNISGSMVGVGTTRGLAFAPKSGTLVKISDKRSYKFQYNSVPFSPFQFSKDSGKTWTTESYTALDASYSQGTAAISADGAVALWTPFYKTYKNSNGGDSAVWGTYPVIRSADAAYKTVAGIDGAWIVGDQVDANVFFAYKQADGTFWKSSDKGLTFTQVSVPGKSDYNKFHPAPGLSGDLWLPLAKSDIKGALLRSKDGGTTWNAVAGLDSVYAVGFGKAAPSATYPAIYAYAAVAGVRGVYQSIDEGATWARIDDDQHRYGGLANGALLIGDMNTFGVVYMSTAGRGIAARLTGEGSGTTAIGSVKTLRSGLARTNAHKQGSSLILTDLPAGTSVEILTLQGRRVSQQTAASSELKIQLPSSSLHVVRLKAAGQVRDFLR